MGQFSAHNMRLIAQDTLRGDGAMGEGMAMSKSRDGRRIMWLAHEHAPRNFTGVDVSDPRKPKVIVQIDLAHNDMRSNSLDVVGDLLAVAYQSGSVGGQPAGLELFDISVPESPKSVSFFDSSGPFSRGVHALWFADGEFIHCCAGAPDHQPSIPTDHLIYRIIDVRKPSKPEEAGRWWFPGSRMGEAEPPPRLPKFGPQPGGVRCHNTNVYPERPNRAYVGYFDGGAVILDITDKARPKPVSYWNPAPPYHGLTHTVLPLLSRDLLVVTEEAVVDGALDWPKLTWVVDARNETNLVPVAICPLPPVEEFRDRGGRFGSHNLHENKPGDLSFQSDRFVFGTYFNGGVRVFDLANPHRPEAVAHFVPEAPDGSPVGSAQINDVYVDENGLVYAVDRYTGGLYVLEVDL